MAGPFKHSLFEEENDETLFFERYRSHQEQVEASNNLVDHFVGCLWKRRVAYPFWDYLLRKSMKLGIANALLSIVSLMALQFVFWWGAHCGVGGTEGMGAGAGAGVGAGTGAETAWGAVYQRAFFVTISVWIFLDLLILVGLLVFSYQPLRPAWRRSAIQFWLAIGDLIVLLRLLLLLRGVLYRFLSSDACPIYHELGMHDPAYPSVTRDFTLPALQVAINFFQTMCLTTNPFPWPWALWFNLIEFVHILYILESCSSRLPSGAAINDIFMMTKVALALVFVVELLGATQFEVSVLLTFYNNDRQRTASREKGLLINILCSRIKTPLLYYTTMVSNHLETQSQIDRHAMLRNQYLANLLVDDILLITKIEEGRFQPSPPIDTNLVELLSEVVENPHVVARTPTPHSIHVLSFVQHFVLISRNSVQSILNNLIHYLALLLDGLPQPPETTPPFQLKVVIQMNQNVSIAQYSATLNITVHCDSPGSATRLSVDPNSTYLILIRSLVDALQGQLLIHQGDLIEIFLPCSEVRDSDLVVYAYEFQNHPIYLRAQGQSPDGVAASASRSRAMSVAEFATFHPLGPAVFCIVSNSDRLETWLLGKFQEAQICSFEVRDLNSLARRYSVGSRKGAGSGKSLGGLTGLQAQPERSRRPPPPSMSTSKVASSSSSTSASKSASASASVSATKSSSSSVPLKNERSARSRDTTAPTTPIDSTAEGGGNRLRLKSKRIHARHSTVRNEGQGRNQGKGRRGETKSGVRELDDDDDEEEGGELDMDMDVDDHDNEEYEVEEYEDEDEDEDEDESFELDFWETPLNGAALSVDFRAIFASSAEICKRLRACNYKGQLILFSGNAIYQDKQTKSLCWDAELSIPCSDLDLIRIIEMLRASPAKNPAEAQEASSVRLAMELSGIVQSAAYLSTGQPKRLDVRQTLGQRFEYSEAKKFGVRMFFREVELSFTQWRVLYPIQRSKYNRTSMIAVRSLMLMIGAVLLIRKASSSRYTYVAVGTFTFAFLQIIRQFVYDHLLRPLKISLYDFWRLLAMGSCLIMFSTIVNTFVDTGLSSFTIQTYGSATTVAEFAATNLHEKTGLDIILSFIGNFLSNAGWLSFFPWPWSLYFMIMTIARRLLMVGLVFRRLFSSHRTLYYAFLVLNVEFALVSLKNLYWLEMLHRNEYQTFRQQIFSSNFIEICYRVWTKDLQSPLQSILESYSSVLSVLQDLIGNAQLNLSQTFLEEWSRVSSCHSSLGDLHRLLGLREQLQHLSQLYAQQQQQAQAQAKAQTKAQTKAQARQTKSKSWDDSTSETGVKSTSGWGMLFALPSSSPLPLPLPLPSSLPPSLPPSSPPTPLPTMTTLGATSGLGDTFRNMRPVLFRNEVWRVCSSNLADWMGFENKLPVKVFVSVDIRLAVISTNMELFRIVLSHGLRVALRNIERKLTRLPSERRIQQEIYVDLQLLESTTSGRGSFLDPRLMLVKILDTGSPPPKVEAATLANSLMKLPELRILLRAKQSGPAPVSWVSDGRYRGAMDYEFQVPSQIVSAAATATGTLKEAFTSLEPVSFTRNQAVSSLQQFTWPLKFHPLGSLCAHEPSLQQQYSNFEPIQQQPETELLRRYRRNLAIAAQAQASISGPNSTTASPSTSPSISPSISPVISPLISPAAQPAAKRDASRTENPSTPRAASASPATSANWTALATLSIPLTPRTMTSAAVGAVGPANAAGTSGALDISSEASSPEQRASQMSLLLLSCSNQHKYTFHFRLMDHFQSTLLQSFHLRDVLKHIDGVDCVLIDEASYENWAQEHPLQLHLLTCLRLLGLQLVVAGLQAETEATISIKGGGSKGKGGSGGGGVSQASRSAENHFSERNFPGLAFDMLLSFAMTDRELSQLRTLCQRRTIAQLIAAPLDNHKKDQLTT